jgi:hypothetical protein
LAAAVTVVAGVATTTYLLHNSPMVAMMVIL